MDGTLAKSGKGMTATVIREFTPSRIERQLLAQVFELICAQQYELNGSLQVGMSATSTQCDVNDAQVLKAKVARRRAA